jgi:hypothetical protein
MAIDIPSSGDTAGIAASSTESITNFDPFITGDEPSVVTTDELVAASQNIPARTPVGFSSGALVPAVQGTTQAVGITLVAVVTGAGETTTRAPIYRQGVFNPDMINWPASYDTVDKKKSAFNGAPTPTSIVIRAPRTMTVP